ncbi:MAG: hypothetical protein JRG94_00225 [Deltaproteobacteria bacterium]|nr:hypothetical protein [Deltaproteobacteria bacterium]
MRKNLNRGPKNLKGVVDMHTHPMSHLGFGNKVFFGAPGLGVRMPSGTIHACNAEARPAATIREALGSCYAAHGGHDAIKNGCGNHVRRIVLNEFENGQETNKPHDVEHPGGFPSFTRWPKHDDLLHQMMWVDWIRRSYEGGLRVMVALAVNNMTLARGAAGDTPYDDGYSGNLQIEEIKRFVGRYDFMEIARTSNQLRNIVGKRDKLAIVLGVELDDIGSFVWNKRVPTAAMIRGEVQRLHQMGVRYIFPVHITDNLFGGTAIYEGGFARANRYQFGSWWNVGCSRPEQGINHKVTTGWDVFATFALGGAGGTQPVPYCPDGIGYVNKRPLQPAGKVALDHMMKLGMIIDIDHMSRGTVEGTLAHTALPSGKPSYPVVSGHNGLGDAEVNENFRTEGHYRELMNRGSIAGVGWADKTSIEWLNLVKRVAATNIPIALGTDVNGFAKMPPPRPVCMTSACIRYSSSFRPSRLGNKTWDYNKEGVAHYGLMPEFLMDVEAQPDGGKLIVSKLFDGAEAFAAMWGRAESQARWRTSGPVVISGPKRMLGEECARHVQCGSGACDAGMGTSRTDTCVPLNGTGRNDDHCSHDAHCQSGLTCKGLRASGNQWIPGKCGGKESLGQSCQQNGQCASGACDAGWGTSKTNTCVPRNGTGNRGDHCSHDAHCRPGRSCQGLHASGNRWIPGTCS